MAYDVSALSAYTDQESPKYIYASIAEGQTVGMIPNIQTGIKSAEKIKIIATNAVWQAGGACEFNPSGDTTFSDRTLTIGKIKENLSWCEKDLESKYTQKQLAAGSTYEALTFEREFVDILTKNTQMRVEYAVWSGDTSSTDAYLNKFDGFRKIIGAASGVLSTAESGGTAWNETNARTIMKGFATKLAASLPQLVGMDDLVLFIGSAEYMTLKQKYITDDLFNINANQGVMTVEGTDVPIVPVLGLSGKKEMYLMRKSNMYLGCDLSGEEDQLKIWYSEDDDIIKYKKEFKMGVQVAFPSEIIKFISA